MRKQTFVFIWMVFSTFAFAQNGPRTMRVDYYHSGNASQEMFSLDRVVVEPLGWPGNLRKTIDDTNLGKYLFEVGIARRIKCSTPADLPPSTGNGKLRAKRSR